MRLVQHRASHITSEQNQVWRSTAVRLSNHTIKGEGKQPWPELRDADLALSVETGRAAIDALTAQIERLEEVLLKRVGLSPQFQVLKTVTGIGPILALTIALEVGDIKRFPGVGEFASYCRCVDSQQLRNAKKKGEANRKKRQSISRLGVHGGGTLRHRIPASSAALLRTHASDERCRVPRTFWGSSEPRADAVAPCRAMALHLIQMGVWCASATDVQPRETKDRMRVERRP
jgi:hypothetical protein